MSNLNKKPEIKEKLAPSKLIKIILGITFIASALFLIFYNLIINKNDREQAQKDQSQLLSSENSMLNNVDNDDTIRKLQQTLNSQEFMARKQSQINASINTGVGGGNGGFNANQIRMQIESQENNKMVKIGTYQNYSAEVPPITEATQSSGPDPQQQARQQREQDMQQARKSQIKISLNIQNQNTNQGSESSQLSNKMPQDFQTTQVLTSTVNSSSPSQSSNYKIIADKDGFYMNTGGNDSQADLKNTQMKTKYRLKAGTFIPSIMQGGVNSDTPGAIVARVKQNVYDTATGKYLIIPKGATLLGSYSSNVQYGQERVICAWNKLIYPDGSETLLKGQPGTDMAGMAGIMDQVNNHYWSLFGDAFVLSVITAGVQYNQQQYSQNFNGGQSFGNAMSQSTGQVMGQAAAQVIQKGLNVSPTLIIRNGYNFNIMLTQDLIIDSPYQVQTYGVQ